MTIAEISREYFLRAVAYRKAGQITLAIGAFRIFKSVRDYA